MPEYRGLTWDHPRGYRALEESTKVWWEKGFRILWDRQPLERFESAKIDELCRAYDLVVFDHPHVGEVVEANCLFPLEEWLPEEAFQKVRAESIGSTLASYHYSGKHWALPLDAATQVLAYRPDLLNGRKPPHTWSEVRTFADRFPIGLSLAGPHALLSFFSICLAHGETPFSRKNLISPEVGIAALEIMSDLFQQMELDILGLNPIGILEEMSRGDRIACCPLIYGYVNYAAPSSSDCHPVKFANTPLVKEIGKLGSTLGGAGIGVSKRAEITEDLIAYLVWLLNRRTQIDFLPSFGGQPSLLPAWIDPDVNRRWNGFYQDTLGTIQEAWVRPRYPGYIQFQSQGSDLLRQNLGNHTPAPEIFRILIDFYHQHPPNDREL
jgi:multiple sugar transport system substrate-binding protein